MGRGKRGELSMLSLFRFNVYDQHVNINNFHMLC
jgi:hypothetical protein